MYAVFSTGGKQYRASTGDVITVEKLEAEKGSSIELGEVLLVGEGKDIQVGTPFLEGGKVTARVVEHGRGDKIKIIKFKRRKNHLKTQGHRQYFTTLEITSIESAVSKPKESEPAQAAAAPKKKAAAKKAAARKPAAKKAGAKKAASKKTTSKKTTAKKTAVKASAAKDKGGE